MRRRPARVATAIATVALLTTTACSAGSKSSSIFISGVDHPTAATTSEVSAPASTTTSGVARSTTAATAPWSTELAASNFLTMAQPSSDSGNAALKTDPNASLTVWRDSVSKYLNDLVVYERALVAGNWPITIRPKTAALSQSVGAEVAVLRAAFAKGSVGELTGTVTGNSATFDAARAAETTVRSSLGLPAA